MILVPATYKGLHPRTLPSLNEKGWSGEVAWMENDFSYYFRLRYEWERNAPFVVVEHDVELVDDAVTDMLSCPRVWCSNPYEWRGSGYLLGCTKFIPSKIGRWPLPDAVPWIQLDMQLAYKLRDAGYSPHLHRNRILHHHGWNSS